MDSRAEVEGLIGTTVGVRNLPFNGGKYRTQVTVDSQNTGIGSTLDGTVNVV